MSALPDHDIARKCSAHLYRQRPLIEPFWKAQLQPASYDVRLSDELLVPISWSHPLDLGEPTPDDTYRMVEMDEDGFLLGPGEFVLGSTDERVNIPNGIVGRIEGKSSIGRLGLTVHVTAGYLDPGFCGCITLEIANLFPRAIRLRPGILIAQLGFEYMSEPCALPYGSAGLNSKYQGAAGVQGSRHGI